MHYTDGIPIHINDYVRVEQVWHGRVVALFAQNQYAADFPADEWSGQLDTGVMVLFDEVGLVYYADEELAEELTLVARFSCK